MSNSFIVCPTHFSRGGENFSKGASSSLVTGLMIHITQFADCSLRTAVTLTICMVYTQINSILTKYWVETESSIAFSETQKYGL